MPNLSYPFLQDTFLKLLEESGSVNEQTGWQPKHLSFNSSNGEDTFMPLYAKTHSWGEYVFDWAWADAYHRYSLNYYPKLLTAIPFTPATGPRIRCDKPLTQTIVDDCVDRVLSMAERENYSSWHILFVDQQSLPLLQNNPNLMHRTSVQYHWHNNNYHTFDDFLLVMKSRKRKMIKRERATIAESGLEVKMLQGHEIDLSLWQFFYRLYVNTYLKRSGNSGYLTESFFQLLGEKMANQVAMAVAYKEGEPQAAALYFYDDNSLYGRYWGCRAEYEYLHFELCYYQGIDFAISQGLKRFDAGAQGEHKIMRGFEPQLTHSMHWIANPSMATAIGDFLKREHQHNLQHILQGKQLLPYKEG